MGFSRVAVAFALVFTYPLAFVGCRDGLLEMMKVPKEERTDAKVDQLTYMILATVTAVALKITDLSFIMSFGGATLGNALIYVYPVRSMSAFNFVSSSCYFAKSDWSLLE